MIHIGARAIARQTVQWRGLGAKTSSHVRRYFSTTVDERDKSTTKPKEAVATAPDPPLTDMPDHQLQRIVTNVYTSDESTGNEPPREDRNEPDHTPDDTTNLADLPGQQLQRLVSNVYTVVEGDLKSSWSRVLAVQTVTDSRLRQNAYVLAQLGTGIRVAPNPNAIEADELLDDGSSRLETEFPIVGGQAKAKVCVTAVIDAGNCMHYSRFLYVNDETGETIDFMCPMGQLTGIRLDSDYKEIKTPPPSVF